MGKLDYKEFTRRRRPHYNPPDGTIFTTFRLAGSIPKATVREYKTELEWHRKQLCRIQRLSDSKPSDEHLKWLEKIETLNRKWFIKTEDILHRAQDGPMWLADHAVAQKVADNLHRLDGELLRLDAYSIMSNHVHSVFQPFFTESDMSKLGSVDDELMDLVLEDSGLPRIMFLLKGRSARECNKVLGRLGRFWEHESFDRVIRWGKFDQTVKYVLNNPVKAALVKNWEDWRWNYCRQDLVERFRKK